MRSGMTHEEMAAMCMRGQQGLWAEDYELLFYTIKARATQGALEYKASTLTQFQDLVSPSGSKPAATTATTTAATTERSKNAKKAVLYVTAEAEQLAMAVRQGGDSSNDPPPCTTCDIFHPRDHKGPCPFYDPSKKKINIQGMLAQQGVLIQMRDRSWVVGTWFKKKLEFYGFKKMGVDSAEDRAKLIAAMDKVAKEVGKADKLPANLGGWAPRGQKAAEPKAAPCSR